MEVNEALVEKLAHLARLHFNNEEKKEIIVDLRKMIDFVEKLNELNLEGVAPMLHVSEEVNIFRDDEIKGTISREEALKNAPANDGLFFKVPKVIRK